jgi:YesN/AraC family two-component response regulator
VRDVSKQICNHVNKNKESANTELRDKIEKYINQNYQDFNMSVKAMAQEFDMNPSYLSRYFKNQVGLSISDYIFDLRMKKTKEILLTTNLTVKEIAIKCGYIDVAYFTRKFKEIESETPSEYRRRYKKIN